MNNNPYDLKREAILWGAGVLVMMGMAGSAIIWGRYRIRAYPVQSQLKTAFPDGRFTDQGVWVNETDSPWAIWKWVAQNQSGIASLETQATESGYHTTIRMKP